jgi:hypothetical protein
MASKPGGFETGGKDTKADNAIVTLFGPEDHDNHTGLGSRPCGSDSGLATLAR